LSIEKDVVAWQTLRLRAFRRQFGTKAPPSYCQAIRGEVSIDAAYAAHPSQADAASHEAIQLELGASNRRKAIELVQARIATSSPWVLVGGPPCQAYSLIGRARNKGNRTYIADDDIRQTLYVEYLDVLANAAPDVFVMENVKGLLSARLDSRRLFGRLVEDLQSPAAAIVRAGRVGSRRKPRYTIYPLVQHASNNGDPADYIVRAEQHGIPQARHRVILLGVRDDATGAAPGKLRRSEGQTVQDTIGNMPRLRSGISDGPDDWNHWRDLLLRVRSKSWFSKLDARVQREIGQSVSLLRRPIADRGGEFMPSRRAGAESSDAGGVINHSTRSHMRSDLERYMFVSAFGRAMERSPSLLDFPRGLLPHHKSAGKGTGDPAFADRFRVQRADWPATTVTSHIAKDGHYYIHPDPTQCRSLTVREAARLQTFPDDYFFCGPRTAQYHQVGNAVPPRLASQIARIVADLLG
jgi:DNA (cytosine-5)-methyltransferase 1